MNLQFAVTIRAQGDLTLHIDQPIAGGNLTFHLASSDTTKVTVPPTATIPIGSNSVDVPVTGVAAGFATVTATHPLFPSGASIVVVVTP